MNASQTFGNPKRSSLQTITRTSKRKLTRKGRFGNDRTCRKCKKVIQRYEPYVHKYHERCYNSLLIGD